MGVDVAKYSGTVDEAYICGICLDVLEDPVNIPCGHTFCQECIRQAISVSQRCPLDRKPVQESHLITAYVVKSLIAKLPFKCRFHGQGCQFSSPRSLMSSHESSCHHNPSRTFVCQKGCGLTMQGKEFEDHDCCRTLLSLLHEKSSLLVTAESKIRQLSSDVERLESELLFERTKVQQPLVVMPSCSSSTNRDEGAVSRPTLPSTTIGYRIVELLGNPMSWPSSCSSYFSPNYGHSSQASTLVVLSLESVQLKDVEVKDNAVHLEVSVVNPLIIGSLWDNMSSGLIIFKSRAQIDFRITCNMRNSAIVGITGFFRKPHNLTWIPRRSPNDIQLITPTVTTNFEELFFKVIEKTILEHNFDR